MFDRWYKRLGPRYPLAALAVVLRLQHAVLVVGVGFLALYVPISWAEFGALTLASITAQEAYAVLTQRHFRKRLEPLSAWLRGDRAPDQIVPAWRAAASLPFELLRLAWRARYPFAVSFAWCVFAVWLLDLPPWSLAFVYIAAAVSLAQGNVLGFFIVERAMQPVLDDLGTRLSDEADPEAISLPLRRRLLAMLPALNVMTGVAAAGLLADGRPGVDDLGIAVLVVLGIALTLTFSFTLLMAGSIVNPIRRLQLAADRVAEGNLKTRVPVVANDETGALTRAFNRMVSGLQERERLHEAFGTFVDPQLAERVAQDGTDFRGEEVEVSILFMDVRGFTAFAESTPPREVVGRLNELYDEVIPVILRHGGHANKFIGDGLLAVFGAPERHADHADRAVAAALEIARCVEERFAGALRVGVGVNSGLVIVGTIGGGGRLDFTVIGDTVNTAARVESATRDTGDNVLITAETQGRLGDGGETWEERPAVPLKGKAESIGLYAPSAPSSPLGRGD